MCHSFDQARARVFPSEMDQSNTIICWVCCATASHKSDTSERHQLCCKRHWMSFVVKPMLQSVFRARTQHSSEPSLTSALICCWLRTSEWPDGPSLASCRVRKNQIQCFCTKRHIKSLFSISLWPSSNVWIDWEGLQSSALGLHIENWRAGSNRELN